MCIGIPVQVIDKGEYVSLCKGRNGEEQVNMMLIGSQPVGTWVVNFLGSAREVISEEDAVNLNKALDGMLELMEGKEIDVDQYFPDIGEPQEQLEES
ncbi:MAG: HypC/HybG/HupF family hydrogenase formation chaperone [Gammaproteobacteria bacterium]|nr:HypC/HybG/HupF family hydrogenase formation chaperone [Gammaproteobacteria bacterium]